jgi:hypothetical protein
MRGNSPGLLYLNTHRSKSDFVNQRCGTTIFYGSGSDF